MRASDKQRHVGGARAIDKQRARRGSALEAGGGPTIGDGLELVGGRPSAAVDGPLFINGRKKIDLGVDESTGLVVTTGSRPQIKANLGNSLKVIRGRIESRPNASDVEGLGSAALLDVATSGDAGATEVVIGDDTRLVDDRIPLAHTHDWADVIDTPDTLAGYGITDAASDAELAAHVASLGTLATQSGTFSGTHSGTSSGTNTGDERPSNYQSLANAGTSPWHIWYCANNITGQVLGATALVANTLYAMPFVAPEGGCTLDRIAMERTNAGTNNVRIGIYRATSRRNFYPDALIVDSGTISAAGIAVFAATISVALTAGVLYWLVIVSDGAPTIRTLGGGQTALLGFPSTLGTAVNAGASVAFAFAALPTPFPGSAALFTGTPKPALFYRLSA